MRTVLRPHVRDGDYRRDLLVSILLHGALLAFFTVGLALFPARPALELGLGQGAGQGDFVSVGLAAEAGGGAGMYKPPVTPRAESAPPPPPKPEERAVKEAEVPSEVFTRETAPPKPKPPEPPRRAPAKTTEPAPAAREGLIPREADPGKGSAAGGGTGGGFGTGRGVSVGSGSGEGNIDSWYIRQVEQRVGQNWLQTSLGRLEQRVAAEASFVVHPDGQISEIQLEKRSGISAVDLAVLRAIQASNPLPRLPYELRGRTVRFRAVFEYPPR